MSTGEAATPPSPKTTGIGYVSIESGEFSLSRITSKRAWWYGQNQYDQARIPPST